MNHIYTLPYIYLIAEIHLVCEPNSTNENSYIVYRYRNEH